MKCLFFGRCNRPEPDSTDYCYSGLYKSCPTYKEAIEQRLSRMRLISLSTQPLTTTEQQAERLKRLGGYDK